MEIKGSVEDVIFHNPDNGYTVLVLDVDGKPVTATGYLPSVAEGECLRLEGEYKDTPKYGVQFSAKNIYAEVPQSLEGITRFLASGLIYGVGEATAAKIVDRFGADTFRILEQDYRRLAEIPRITEQKAKEIAESYAESASVRNIVIALQSYNISPSMAIRIYRIYGQGTEQVIRNNPYKLVEDVEGIGFLTADRIASATGVSPESTFRLRAGIIYSLTESGNNGHTCLPVTVLLTQVSELLNTEVASGKLTELLTGMAFDGAIKLTNRADGEYAALMNYYMWERAISEKLTSLVNYSDALVTDYSADIAAYERQFGYSFDETQKSAIKSCLNDGIMIITGGPGTGKTTLLKCVIHILRRTGTAPLLLAPTGRAAKRIQESCDEPAQTIHRALQPNFKGRGFVHNENNPLNNDFIVVDEMSMVDAYLMCSLLRAVRQGTRLVLMGDKDQLPSVGAGNVLSDLLSSGALKVTELKFIYRQAQQSMIITNAHLVNNGKMPVFNNGGNSDFFFSQSSNQAQLLSTVVNMATHRIPEYLKIDPLRIQVLAPMKNGHLGIHNLNRELQSELNPPQPNKRELKFGDMAFRVGDKVMHISNNYDLAWIRYDLSGIPEQGSGVFNGDIGTVDGINPNTRELAVAFEDGRTAIYTHEALEELTLAYAITIHKSQGCEFDVVIMPVVAGSYMILTRNLLYTAITRAKTMVVLVGSKDGLARMVTNDYQSARYTQLTDLLRTASDKFRLLTAGGIG